MKKALQFTPVIFKCIHDGPVAWMHNGKELRQKLLLTTHIVYVGEADVTHAGVMACIDIRHGMNIIGQGLLEIESKFFYR